MASALAGLDKAQPPERALSTRLRSTSLGSKGPSLLLAGGHYQANRVGDHLQSFLDCLALGAALGRCLRMHHLATRVEIRLQAHPVGLPLDLDCLVDDIDRSLDLAQ